MGPYIVILSQLILTILIEGAFVLVWKNSTEILGYSVLANLMTNPPLNLALLYLIQTGTSSVSILKVTALIEIAAVIAEALAYRGMMKLDFKKALGMSLALNLTSYVLGTVLGMLGYWDILGIVSRL